METSAQLYYQPKSKTFNVQINGGLSTIYFLSPESLLLFKQQTGFITVIKPIFLPNVTYDYH